MTGPEGCKTLVSEWIESSLAFFVARDGDVEKTLSAALEDTAKAIDAVLAAGSPRHELTAGRIIGRPG